MIQFFFIPDGDVHMVDLSQWRTFLSAGFLSKKNFFLLKSYKNIYLILTFGVFFRSN